MSPTANERKNLEKRLGQGKKLKARLIKKEYSDDSEYKKYAILRALIVQMQYSDLFKKRIRDAVKEILRINQRIDLKGFSRLHKELN